MTNRTRLARLEIAAATGPARLEKAATTVPAQDRHLTPEQWIERLERMARDGYFDKEPDFPRALAAFRSAVDDVKRSLCPPWERPKYLICGSASPRQDPIYFSETHHGYPKVGKAATCLVDMIIRVHQRSPDYSPWR